MSTQAVTPDQQQFQYIKLPDGSYGKFRADQSDAEIHSILSQQYPKEMAAADAAQSQQAEANKPGFLSSLGSDLWSSAKGLGSLVAPPETTSDKVLSVLGPGTLPFVRAARGYFNSVQASKQAAEDAAQANDKTGVVMNSAAAGLPLVGPLVGGVYEHAQNNTLPSSLGMGLSRSLQAMSLAPEGGAIPNPAIGAAKLVGSAADAIPSAARAGETFQNVMGAAKGQPVPMTEELGSALSRYQDLVNRGGSRSMAVSRLFNRLTAPDAAPMTYAEARDFYSNISRLSADEFGRLTPVMKQQVGAVRVALNDAIQRAAGQVGKAGAYGSAMKEYANAAKLKDVSNAALDLGKQVAVRYLPWLATAYGAKRIYDTTK